MGVVGVVWRLVAILLLAVVLFCCAVVTIGGAYLLVADWRTRGCLERGVFILSLAAAVAVAVLCRAVIRSLWLGLNLPAFQKRAGTAPVFITSGPALRLFESPGQVEFTPCSMVISGKIHPDEFRPFIVGVGFALLWTLLCSTILAAYAKAWIFVAAGWAIGMLALRRSPSRAQDCTLSIGRGDVADCRWRGPLAELTLKERTAEGIERLRFVVSREAGEWFFREFNRVFPDLLPQAYLTALSAQAAHGEGTSLPG